MATNNGQPFFFYISEHSRVYLRASGRIMTVFSYMPMPCETFDKREDICLTLCAMLPVDITHPNGTTGTWGSCFRTPTAVRLTNAFLWLMAVADAALVTVYIETIPDYNLLHDGGVAVVRFYRLLVPLTENDTRAVIMHMANMLADEPPPKQGSKRQRTSSGSTPVDKHAYTERNAAGEVVEPHPLSNTKLDYKYLNSEKAFLQYFSTATAGSMPYVSEVDFTCPPVAVNNTVNSDSDDSDDDDNDNGADNLNQFDQWFELLPTNNILKLLDINIHFATGTNLHDDIHADQLDISQYISPGEFKFPDVSIDNGLILEIRHNAPFMCKSPNTLIGNFLLPGATLWSMTAEELLCKIECCAQIRGDRVPDDYYDMPFNELRQVWRAACIAGADVTYYDPVDMDPVESRASVLTTDSDRTLAQIYPPMGHMKHRLTDVEFQTMRTALIDNDISEATMSRWRGNVIRKILAFWAGQPQDGFVKSYFTIRVEAMSLHSRLRRQKDHVTADAKRYRQIHTAKGMDAVNSRILVSADLLRGPLHLTPPQAATCFLMFITSHTTYKPEIGGLQITIVLCGGYGTGKSHSIECAHNMLPASCRVSLDMSSKKAITANKVLGVVKQDEWKIGVQGGVGELDHLTAMATGTCHYNRFLLNTTDGQRSENIMIVSDQRETIYTASNLRLEPRVEARVIAITHSGMKIDGAPGAEEHATLSNTTPDVQAALLFFQSVFAEHTQLHVVRQLLRYNIEKSYFPLWYGLATTVMGQEFAPQPRQIKSINSVAEGIMMFRLVTEYDSKTASVQGAPSFTEYAMANSVVTMYDYTLAYYMLSVNTSKALEESSVAVALKSAIQLSAEGGDKLLSYNGNYFITSLRTPAEVMVRCKGKMSKASGLVASVMTSLQSANGKGVEPSVITINSRSSNYVGQYAVLKSVAAPCNLDNMLPAQTAIMEFFKADVLNETNKVGKPLMHFVSFDEEWVIFHRNVYDRLLNPHLASVRFGAAPSLTAARVSQDDIRKAMYLFEAAGVLKFRVPDHHPDDLDGEACTVSNHKAGALSVPVTHGGPLDPGRILPDYMHVQEATTEDADWREAQVQQIGATRTPGARPFKAPLTVANSIMVSITFLTQTLDLLERTAHGIETEDSTHDKLPCGTLFDAVFAVSGEYVPGDKICLGPNPSSAVVASVHEVREYPEAQITVVNPRHRQPSFADHQAARTRDSVLEMLLPAADKRVVFDKYDPDSDEHTLTSKIRQRLAVANGVPLHYCNGVSA